MSRTDVAAAVLLTGGLGLAVGLSACRGAEDLARAAAASVAPAPATSAAPVGASPPAAVPAPVRTIPVPEPGPEAQALLAIAVDHEAKTPARVTALRSLGTSGDRGAVVPLAALLDAEEASIEPAVRAALTQLEGTRTLTEQLGSADEAGREQAALLLARVGDRSAVPALLRALADPSPEVRAQVASSLGALREPSADEALAARLSTDESADVRIACAQALGRVASPRAGAALEAARGTETDAFVRVAIEQAQAAIAAPPR